jgi:hypothetical protein
VKGMSASKSRSKAGLAKVIEARDGFLNYS